MNDDDVRFMLGEIRSDVKTLLAREKDQETRLRRVETRQWYAAGVSAALGAVAVKLGIPFLPH